ncbi:hypothetical protein ACHAWF_000447 [Thalassiosira exigua]
MGADVMFVCGLPFMLTLSRGLDFVTIQYVPKRTAPELANAVKNVLNVHKRAGIIPVVANMDGEFEKLKPRLSKYIEINTTGKGEHVNEAERKIRVVKERSRCTTHDMPFKILPNEIIKGLVVYSVMWMNAWKSKNGVSN